MILWIVLAKALPMEDGKAKSDGAVLMSASLAKDLDNWIQLNSHITMGHIFVFIQCPPWILLSDVCKDRLVPFRCSGTRTSFWRERKERPTVCAPTIWARALMAMGNGKWKLLR